MGDLSSQNDLFPISHHKQVWPDIVIRLNLLGDKIIPWQEKRSATI